MSRILSTGRVRARRSGRSFSLLTILFVGLVAIELVTLAALSPYGFDENDEAFVVAQARHPDVTFPASAYHLLVRGIIFLGGGTIIGSRLMMLVIIVGTSAGGVWLAKTWLEQTLHRPIDLATFIVLTAASTQVTIFSYSLRHRTPSYYILSGILVMLCASWGAGVLCSSASDKRDLADALGGASLFLLFVTKQPSFVVMSGLLVVAFAIAWVRSPLDRPSIKPSFLLGAISALTVLMVTQPNPLAISFRAFRTQRILASLGTHSPRELIAIQRSYLLGDESIVVRYAAVVLILVGMTWALFRFVSGRTLSDRLSRGMSLGVPMAVAVVLGLLLQRGGLLRGPDKWRGYEYAVIPCVLLFLACTALRLVGRTQSGPVAKVRYSSAAGLGLFLVSPFVAALGSNLPLLRVATEGAGAWTFVVAPLLVAVRPAVAWDVASQSIAVAGGLLFSLIGAYSIVQLARVDANATLVKLSGSRITSGLLVEPIAKRQFSVLRNLAIPPGSSLVIVSGLVGPLLATTTDANPMGATMYYTTFDVEVSGELLRRACTKRSTRAEPFYMVFFPREVASSPIRDAMKYCGYPDRAKRVEQIEFPIDDSTRPSPWTLETWLVR